jgi:hypothetical protein
VFRIGVRRALSEACANSHWKTARWLAKHFVPGPVLNRAPPRIMDPAFPFALPEAPTLLILAYACAEADKPRLWVGELCAQGRRLLARRVVALFSPDTHPGENLSTVYWFTARADLFSAYERAGDSPVPRWGRTHGREGGPFLAARGITMCIPLHVADAWASINVALCEACEGGHLEIARRLTAHFALTAADARDGSNHALRHACKGGHLPTARWLADHFGLTTTDARSEDNCALDWACRNGHLKTAQWLVDHFRLTAADARANGNTILRGAFAGGHSSTARWLIERFGLTPADERAATVPI